MHTILDPDELDVVQEHRHGEYGPSDTSDSASDVLGTDSEATESDASGTGERPSVEFIAPNQTESDIPPEGGVKDVDRELDPESGDETESDDEFDEDLEGLKSVSDPDGSSGTKKRD